MPPLPQGVECARSSAALVRTALQHFERRYMDAEGSWTLTETLSELGQYLSNIDKFSPQPETARYTQARLRWLTNVLVLSAGRENIETFEPTRLYGIYGALSEHDTALTTSQNVSAKECVAARRIAQIELDLLTES